MFALSLDDFRQVMHLMKSRTYRWSVPEVTWAFRQGVPLKRVILDGKLSNMRLKHINKCMYISIKLIVLL